MPSAAHSFATSIDLSAISALVLQPAVRRFLALRSTSFWARR
jgi:hypothetical protein